MKQLIPRQIRKKLFGLTIIILALTMVAPSVLSAAPTWQHYYGDQDPDPEITSRASGGANDAGNHLFGIGFEVSIDQSYNYAGSFIVRLDRSQSGDPFVEEDWRKGMGGLTRAIARGVATDRRKDAYVVGEAAGRGGLDAFIRKYRKDGVKLWTKRFHNGQDAGHGVAADSARNVYMVGGIAAPEAASLNRGAEAFIIKYNENGRKLWGRRFGSINDDGASAVAVDSRRNVYVAGITDGRMGQRFGDIDVFLRKYSRTGKHLWTRQFGTPKQERGVNIAIDEYGKIYVAGVTKGTFRGFRRRSGQKFFLRKYDYKGKGLWTRQFGRAQVLDRPVGHSSFGVTTKEHVGLAVDPGNNVYVSGKTRGGRIHVQKFNRRGRSRWSRDPISAGASADLTIDNSSFYIFGGPDPFVAKFPN